MNVLAIFQPVAGLLAQVESELQRQVDHLSADPILQTTGGEEGAGIVRHIFETSGKHLRPALLLLSGRAVGWTPGGVAAERAMIEMAVAAELLHTASLVHDDVIDEAELRRGRASLNTRYSNRIAVLVGDLLYTQFFRLVSGLPGVAPALKLRLLDSFSSVTRRMCLGELAEERLRWAGSAVGLDGYLNIIGGKTASLMSGCCLAGALLGGADEASAGIMADYGRLLGFSYQLMDDILDSDSVFPVMEALKEKLRQCAAEAQAAVGRLVPNPITKRLDWFARTILDRGLEKAPA